MKEILSLRQENSKTFDLGGGKRQWQGSIGAIHYKDNYADKSEEWKDIDLTWEGNKIIKAPYELTLEGNKATLKDKKRGEVSTIELLNVMPAGLQFEVIPDLSTVRFRHTLPADKIPFEAKFRVSGKIPFRTRALDDEGELELETTLRDSILTEGLSAVKDKRTGKVRPVKGDIRIDPTWQVGEQGDDAHRSLNPSECTINEIHLISGALGAANFQYGCGMRFQGVTIPQSSIIDTAHLQFRCETSQNQVDVESRISAEDVDDAAIFIANGGVFDTRWAARTTARVDWDNIEAWTAGEDYDSPEIKTVIKEIVDRGGWVSGQDIAIFWDDFDDRNAHAANQWRMAESFDGDNANCPKLIVTFHSEQDVGGGAVAIAGTLGIKVKTSPGGGSVAIAGSLGRNIFVSVGAGAVSIIGTLIPIKRFIQAVGGGSIAIASILGWTWIKKKLRLAPYAYSPRKEEEGEE